MAVLEWDKPEEKLYQAGVDRGIISMIVDGVEVVEVWNGLTSVEESGSVDVSSYYMDGVKYMINAIPGDFSGNLKAITYPDLFELAIGIKSLPGGIYLSDQPLKSFNLSYRTKIGTELSEGYKVHLLYNVTASPNAQTFETISNEISPVEFDWDLTAIPEEFPNHRPMAHLSISSLDDSGISVLSAIERSLYGTADSDPHFPSIEEIINTFSALYIEDNGDGTWSATDADDVYITMLDSTTFQIDNANARYIDPDTYTIDDTELLEG
jgi:hypothetical protein